MDLDWSPVISTSSAPETNLDEFDSSNDFVAQINNASQYNVSYWDRGIAVSRATERNLPRQDGLHGARPSSIPPARISRAAKATASKGLGGNMFVAVDNSDPDP